MQRRTLTKAELARLESLLRRGWVRIRIRRKGW
jgi:hypothetical protein